MFSAEAWFGQELRRRLTAVVRIGAERGLGKSPVVFAHAGLSPEILRFAGFRGAGWQKHVKGINAAVGSAMLDGSICSKEGLFGSEGPFWLRRHAMSSDAGDGSCTEVEEVLAKLESARVVVGHTAQADGRVRQRCAGRLLLADTHISAAMTGVAHPSALSFRDCNAMALYQPFSQDADLLPEVCFSPVTSNGMAPAMRWSLMILNMQADVPPPLSSVRRRCRAIQAMLAHRDTSAAEGDEVRAVCERLKRALS
jgi:hypothetical protein